MSVNFQTVMSEDIDEILAKVPSWAHFSGQSVLVTGASGFLGGYFVRVLLALNLKGRLAAPVSVIAAVRDLDQGRGRFSDLLDDDQLSMVHLDLAQIAVPDLPPADYVIHAASQASPRFYGVDPVGTILPNTVGTAALLAAVQNTGLKGFLFISSSEVYGSADAGAGYIESTFGLIDPVDVRACYGESKRLGETICVAWHEQYGVPTYIVRPFHTYGPGLVREDGRVFADFVFNVVDGKNIVIRGDGTARRAFCYVSDAVSGIFAVLAVGEVAVPYNVANPEGEYAIGELAEIIVDIFPEKRLQVERLKRPEGTGYIPSTCKRVLPDIGRLKRLGWSPTVTPARGFERTIRAYL